MKDNYIAVIGDIHGCINTLKKLYGKIKNRNVYTVGDIVDRGAGVKSTLNFCIENKIKSVRGNHEHWMIQALMNKDNPYYLKKWIQYGGDTTVRSYLKLDSSMTVKNLYDAANSAGHLKYISEFPLKYEIDNVIISHAGLIKDGDEKSIFFNYERPLKIDGKLQVFGHRPFQQSQIIKGWYANLDSGCVEGYKLTCAIIDTHKAEISDLIEIKNCE